MKFHHVETPLYLRILDNNALNINYNILIVVAILSYYTHQRNKKVLDLKAYGLQNKSKST